MNQKPSHLVELIVTNERNLVPIRLTKSIIESTISSLVWQVWICWENLNASFRWIRTRIDGVEGAILCQLEKLSLWKMAKYWAKNLVTLFLTQNATNLKPKFTVSIDQKFVAVCQSANRASGVRAMTTTTLDNDDRFEQLFNSNFLPFLVAFDSGFCKTIVQTRKHTSTKMWEGLVNDWIFKIETVATLTNVRQSLTTYHAWYLVLP